MNRSSIAPEILQPYLDSATNAADKGQAQWFTPPAWAKLLATPLPLHRPAVLDLTCGRGDLVRGAANSSTKHKLGSDIQPSAFSLQPSGFIPADITLLFPLLQELEFRADLFVLNPPWDLHWHRSRLASLAESRIPAVRAAWEGMRYEVGGMKRAGSGSHTSSLIPHPSPRSWIDSTVATLMMALELGSDQSEGYIICNAATVQRLILDDDAPHVALRDHVWAVLTVEGNICEKAKGQRLNAEVSDPLAFSLQPSEFRTAVLYFAQAHDSGPKWQRHYEEKAEGERLNAKVRDQDTSAFSLQPSALPSRSLREGSEVRHYLCTHDTHTLWQAAREQWQLHTSSLIPHPFNIWLTPSGHIRTHLSLFEQHSVKVDKAAAAYLNELNGKRPMQLVLQRAQRDALLQCIGAKAEAKAEGERLKAKVRDPELQPSAFSLQPLPWRVQPALIAAVHAAIRDYHAQRAPLYPLPEIQRLGYLDEEDEITCKAEGLRLNAEVGTPEPSAFSLQPLAFPFTAGTSYPLRTQSVTIRREGQRPNLAGEMEDIEYTGQELCILVTDGAGREWSFMEARLKADDHAYIVGLERAGREKYEGQRLNAKVSKSDPSAFSLQPSAFAIDFTLQQLVEHFMIPDVPDVATVQPEAYAANLATLEEIEQLVSSQ